MQQLDSQAGRTSKIYRYEPGTAGNAGPAFVSAAEIYALLRPEPLKQYRPLAEPRFPIGSPRSTSKDFTFSFDGGGGK